MNKELSCGKGELSKAGIEAAVELFQALPRHWYPDKDLLPVSFEIAHLTQRSLYDCIYLALARAVEGHATANRKFYNALKRSDFEGYLRWVENIPYSHQMAW